MRINEVLNLYNLSSNPSGLDHATEFEQIRKKESWTPKRFVRIKILPHVKKLLPGNFVQLTWTTWQNSATLGGLYSYFDYIFRASSPNIKKEFSQLKLPLDSKVHRILNVDRSVDYQLASLDFKMFNEIHRVVRIFGSTNSEFIDPEPICDFYLLEESVPVFVKAFGDKLTNAAATPTQWPSRLRNFKTVEVIK